MKCEEHGTDMEPDYFCPDCEHECYRQDWGTRLSIGAAGLILGWVFGVMGGLL